MKFNDPTVLISSSKSSILGWGMVLVFVLLNVFGSLTLKAQVHKFGNLSFSTVRDGFVLLLRIISSGPILLAVGSLFAAIVAWMVVLANLELSRAYPVAIGLNCLGVMIASILFFAEPFSFFKILGIVLILIGIAALLK